MKFKVIHLFVVLTLVAVAVYVYQLDLLAEDWRHGDGMCKLHGVKMRTIVVHSLRGPAPQMMPEFFEAMETNFPNCHVDFGDNFYGEKRGKVYLCPACQKNYQAWNAIKTMD